MVPAERLVRLAAALLPRLARSRYREEWLADLAGAAEAGVSRGGIVAGAFVTTLTISHIAPELTGLSLDRLFGQRLRISSALLGGAAVLAVGYAAYGGYSGPAGPGLPPAVGGAVVVVAIVLATSGIIALGGAVQTAIAARRFALAVTLVAVPVLLASLLIAAPTAVLGAGMLGGPMALVAVAALVVMFSGGSRVLATPARLGVAVGFAVAAALACAVGILHIAVWNPVARVPGLTLDQIYAGLAEAGEATGVREWLIAWAVLTVLAGAALVIVAVVGRRATTRRLIAVGFLLVAGTTAVGLLPAFSMGMSLADTFMTTGGDAAATGPVLAILGQASLVAALLAAFVRGSAPRLGPVGASPHRVGVPGA